jgi:hypothetical protein
MPKRLPRKDIFGGLLSSIGKAVRYWFHYTLVAFAWLGVVPLTACKYSGRLEDKKSNNDSQNTTHKTKDRAKLTPQRIMNELVCSGLVCKQFLLH